MMFRNCRGWSTLELIIIFPLIFLLLVALVQFGLLLNAKLSLTQAAQAGGRIFSTTRDCALAEAVVKQNFVAESITVDCELKGDLAILEVNYEIPNVLPFVDTDLTPFPRFIKARSVTLLEKK